MTTDTVYIIEDVSSSESDLTNTEEVNQPSQNIHQNNEEVNDEEFEVVTEFIECPNCRGLGMCGGCAGMGANYRYGDFVECPCCGGTGRCQGCQGTGMVEVPEGWRFPF
ncbi:MAG: hypothetical protein ACI30R_06490 [Sodaliphilus sp.]